MDYFSVHENVNDFYPRACRGAQLPSCPAVVYLVVSMLVIVVEDVVVPVVTTVLWLDCDAMPDDRLADLLLVRVKPQLMVILDHISKAVRQ